MPRIVMMPPRVNMLVKRYMLEHTCEDCDAWPHSNAEITWHITSGSSTYPTIYYTNVLDFLRWFYEPFTESLFNESWDIFDQDLTYREWHTNVTSGEPLPSVNIQVKHETFGTTTNENGYYVISLSKNSSTLVFSHIGYVSNEIPVYTEQRASFQLNVTLSPTSLQGDTVTVTSSRISPYDQINISTIRLQPRSLQSVPQFVGEADLLRTLQTLPGVTTLNQFRGGLYVRGAPPGQNPVLMDGAATTITSNAYNRKNVWGRLIRINENDDVEY